MFLNAYCSVTSHQTAEKFFLRKLKVFRFHLKPKTTHSTCIIALKMPPENCLRLFYTPRNMTQNCASKLTPFKPKIKIFTRCKFILKLFLLSMHKFPLQTMPLWLKSGHKWIHQSYFNVKCRLYGVLKTRRTYENER